MFNFKPVDLTANLQKIQSSGKHTEPQNGKADRSCVPQQKTCNNNNNNNNNKKWMEEKPVD